MLGSLNLQYFLQSALQLLRSLPQLNAESVCLEEQPQKSVTIDVVGYRVKGSMPYRAIVIFIAKSCCMADLLCFRSSTISHSMNWSPRGELTTPITSATCFGTHNFSFCLASDNKLPFLRIFPSLIPVFVKSTTNLAGTRRYPGENNGNVSVRRCRSWG